MTLGEAMYASMKWIKSTEPSIYGRDADPYSLGQLEWGNRKSHSYLHFRDLTGATSMRSISVALPHPRFGNVILQKMERSSSPQFLLGHGHEK